MLEPLLSDEDDASTASGSSSSESTEFEKHKPTLMQRLKQAVGKSCDGIEHMIIVPPSVYASTHTHTHVMSNFAHLPSLIVHIHSQSMSV